LWWQGPWPAQVWAAGQAEGHPPWAAHQLLEEGRGPPAWGREAALRQGLERVAEEEARGPQLVHGRGLEAARLRGRGLEARERTQGQSRVLAERGQEEGRV
jgi:hypothetical protein